VTNDAASPGIGCVRTVRVYDDETGGIGASLWLSPLVGAAVCELSVDPPRDGMQPGGAYGALQVEQPDQWHLLRAVGGKTRLGRSSAYLAIQVSFNSMALAADGSRCDAWRQ
jgi:hypothetical protein